MDSRFRGFLRSIATTQAAGLLRSGFWLNLSSIVTLLLSFGLSILCANLLPKEVYGTYQYFLSLVAIFTAFTLTGVNSAVTRSVAQGNEGALRESLSPQLRWNVPAVLLALGAAVYYFLYGNAQLALGLLIISCTLPLLTIGNTYTAYLIGKQEFRKYFLYSTLAGLLYYAGIVTVVLVAPSVLFLLAANLALTSLGAWLCLRSVLKRIPKSAPGDPGSITYGKHLSLMNALGVIASQIDTLLVFHFLGPIQLATYTIATLIPEKLSGLLKNTTTSYLPRFAEREPVEVRSSLPRLAIALFALISIGACAYIVILPVFFSVVYPRYIEAVPYSQAFFLTLFAAVGNLIGTVLLAHRNIRRLYVLNIVTPIMQIAFQIIGILWAGLWGLVLARVASSILFSLLTIPIVWGRNLAGRFDPVSTN